MFTSHQKNWKNLQMSNQSGSFCIDWICRDCGFAVYFRVNILHIKRVKWGGGYLLFFYYFICKSANLHQHASPLMSYLFCCLDNRMTDIKVNFFFYIWMSLLGCDVKIRYEPKKPVLCSANISHSVVTADRIWAALLLIRPHKVTKWNISLSWIYCSISK